MSDRRPTPRPTMSLWAGVGVMLANTWLTVAEFPPALAEARISLLIAGAALSGWLMGRWPALSMCGVWLSLEVFLHSAQLSLFGLIVRYAVMTGLILSLSELQRRLAEEFRRGRLDLLTGLPNRQAFVERCRGELSRAKRFARSTTIALLDGDRFKTVNDERGHAAGDRALQATADILRNTIRQYDFAARLGGDEFVVLFPESPVDAAESAVQRLHRELTERLPPEFAPLSYSFGAVTFPPGDWTVEECLRQADRRLYDAKRAGIGLIRTGIAEFSAAASEAALPPG